MTVAVIGDYGGCGIGTDACGPERRIAELVHSWRPSAIVTVGDNSYPEGFCEEVIAAQQPYREDIVARRFYPTPGNHDYGSGSYQCSADYFGRPNEYVAGLAGGLIDLFVNDTIKSDGLDARVAGYRSALRSSKARWKIATSHLPPYSSGEHGSTPTAQWVVQDGVDLFLGGHDHDQEHLVVDGRNFVVNGTGGAELYPVTSRVAGSEWAQDDQYAAVRMRVNQSVLRVEFVAVDGQVLHSFDLTKAT